ncbi:DUF1707 SHOCT-like domain-containing protein [Mycolicibacterium stellerae]|uniref:DUF1707 SHOCT-like domain-containing protein n=1 Tax=Mycolicibacterium stellerae TaxID=2358193 RepID=UPI000F0BD933|nr:DUF1707 domain-containing protein [Mycolicibacterium stellerae]
MATRQTPGTRAKDSDRTEICQALDSALAEGQLSMEEHRQRVSAATHAATLGELWPLVDDLQATNPQAFTTQPTKLPRGPIVVAAVTGGVIVICAAITWALMSSGGSTPDTPDASPSAEAPAPHVLADQPPTTVEEAAPAPEDPPPVVLAPPPNLHSAEGLARVIDEMRKRFGDTTGYELAVMPDEAILARPDPTDDRSKLIYPYENGWGDPSTRTRSDTDDVTDLAAFDVPAAAAALAAAPETLRIAAADVSETFIDIDHVAEPPGPGALELLVKVTTKSGTDGFIYLDGASNIKRVEFPG